MALTYAQIISLSCLVAKCPGYGSLAGQLLNNILDDLCRTYDFDVAKSTYNFAFNTSLAGGAGPFPLPADFLRSDPNDVFFTISGVPYTLIPIGNAAYDATVKTAGFNSYPIYYTTNMDAVPPNMQVWPPASGAYPVTVVYRRLMPSVATPESNNTIPWFPYQSYLRQQLTGELCQLTSDSRAAEMLGDNETQTPNGAAVLLRKYLKMKDNNAITQKSVQRDRRRFGNTFDDLKNTKTIGW